MAKPALKRIYEPDEDTVHYAPDPISDSVTLCGLTDFIHHKQKGCPTRKPITCRHCQRIVAYINDHADPRKDTPNEP